MNYLFLQSTSKQKQCKNVTQMHSYVPSELLKHSSPFREVISQHTKSISRNASVHMRKTWAVKEKTEILLYSKNSFIDKCPKSRSVYDGTD